MSNDPFPERIDPRKLFTRNGEVSGIISLTKLQRLSEYLSNSDGQVVANLSFTHDDNNHCLLSGELSAEVNMLCQRCLKEIVVSLQSSLKVLVLSEKQWSDELVAALPEDTEALQTDEEELDVYALIEDELILSLPIVPHHEEQDCNKELNKLKASNQELEDQVEKSESAFSSLQALKDKLAAKD